MNGSTDTVASEWMSAKITRTKSCGVFTAFVALFMIGVATADEPQDTTEIENDTSVVEAIVDTSESGRPAAVAPGISSSPGSKQSVQGRNRRTSLPPIAAKLPDGRPLRPIRIYQAQMDELIPITIAQSRLNN